MTSALPSTSSAGSSPGLSRRHADRLIRQYDQFGDAYFRLSEIARVSSKTFQQVAPHVASGNDAYALEFGGQKLALIPENAAKIRVAIQALRNQVRHPPAPPRPGPGLVELRNRIDALAADIVKAVGALPPAPLLDAERAGLRTIAVYALDKFRTVARQLDAAA